MNATLNILIPTNLSSSSSNGIHNSTESQLRTHVVVITKLEMKNQSSSSSSGCGDGIDFFFLLFSIDPPCVCVLYSSSTIPLRPYTRLDDPRARGWSKSSPLPLQLFYGTDHMSSRIQPLSRTTQASSKVVPYPCVVPVYGRTNHDSWGT